MFICIFICVVLQPLIVEMKQRCVLNPRLLEINIHGEEKCLEVRDDLHVSETEINQSTSYSFQFTAKQQILFHSNYRNNIPVLSELLDYLMVTNS